MGNKLGKLGNNPGTLVLPKNLREISTWSPPMGAPKVGQDKTAIFDQYLAETNKIIIMYGVA